MATSGGKFKKCCQFCRCAENDQSHCLSHYLGLCPRPDSGEGSEPKWMTQARAAGWISPDRMSVYFAGDLPSETTVLVLDEDYAEG
jgi:hypothetical protein